MFTAYTIWNLLRKHLYSIYACRDMNTLVCNTFSSGHTNTLILFVLCSVGTACTTVDRHPDQVEEGQGQI
jgi:hypothetical protein